jgi:hypothetical protein
MFTFLKQLRVVMVTGLAVLSVVEVANAQGRGRAPGASSSMRSTRPSSGRSLGTQSRGFSRSVSGSRYTTTSAGRSTVSTQSTGTSSRSSYAQTNPYRTWTDNSLRTKGTSGSVAIRGSKVSDGSTATNKLRDTGRFTTRASDSATRLVNNQTGGASAHQATGTPTSSSSQADREIFHAKDTLCRGHWWHWWNGWGSWWGGFPGWWGGWNYRTFPVTVPIDIPVSHPAPATVGTSNVILDDPDGSEEVP